MNSQQIIAALKRELKARNLTYAIIAERVNMSEASIKRMLSNSRLSMSHLDAILTAASVQWSDLVQSAAKQEALLEGLSVEQESALRSDLKLFTVAVCAMNNVPAEAMLADFNMTDLELVQAMSKLDRIGFLTLMPNNRYTLKLSRTFQWIPNGPIQNFFQSEAADYLSRGFTRTGEYFQVVNLLLSPSSTQKIAQRLRDLAQEVNAMHFADMRLPYAAKNTQTMLLAVRPWLPPEIRDLRRPRQSSVTNDCRRQGEA
jgi:transcriptional regulator with XRE-family HTH domain